MIYDQLNETEWSKSTDGVVFVGNLQGWKPDVKVSSSEWQSGAAGETYMIGR